MSQRHSTSVPIRLLCVDDDTYLTDLLRFALARDGYAVEVANTGTEALRNAQAGRPDLVVLDIDLPDTNGFLLCAQFHKLLRLPVVMLTASHLDADMIAGFEQGADDYVVKPFSMQILSYRIRAVLRRSASHLDTRPIRISYQLGSGTFDAEQHEVSGDKARVKLTPIQGKILRLLLENEGRVVCAEQIMTKVWHYEAESDVSVVKTHVSNLRKKISSAISGGELIHTVPGLGYTLRQPAGAAGAPRALSHTDNAMPSSREGSSKRGSGPETARSTSSTTRRSSLAPAAS